MGSSHSGRNLKCWGMWGLNPSLLREKLGIVSSFPLCVDACVSQLCVIKNGVYDKIVSHPLLSIFFLFHQMCTSHSAGFWISFREKNVPYVAVDLVGP